jgi:hypothetical protein
LILGPIRGAQQFVASRRFIVSNSGVVAGGQTAGSDLPRGDEQGIELYVIVAMSAWDRRAPGKIVRDKWLHHGFLEPLLVVHHVVRHSQVLGDALCIVDILERAATLSTRAITVKLRQTALIPQLHRKADNWEPAVHENRRYSRAVHAAAHGDCGQGILIYIQFHHNAHFSV